MTMSARRVLRAAASERLVRALIDLAAAGLRTLRRLFGCICTTKTARSSANFPAGALPNAYVLIEGILTGDVPAANKALAQTTALHCAVAAIVLAQNPRSNDLRESLQLLSIQSEIDEVEDEARLDLCIERPEPHTVADRHRMITAGVVILSLLVCCLLTTWLLVIGS